MTVQPNHPSGCSGKNPHTLLEKRDGERPHSSQNLEQETKIEGSTLCGEIQLNPKGAGDLHEAPQPAYPRTRIANRRSIHHASKKEIQPSHHPHMLNAQIWDHPRKVSVTKAHHPNNLTMLSTMVAESARKLHLPSCK